MIQKRDQKKKQNKRKRHLKFHLGSVFHLWASQVVQNSKESARSVGDLGSIPGSGRSPGEGHDNPPQDSCL